MNSDEVYEIKKTWEIPLATPTDSGAAILVKFLTLHPSNLEKFPFRDVPIDQLPTNPRFRAHASRIIRVFDDSVQALGHDWANNRLEEIWKQIAVTHFPRNISKESYNHLKAVVLEVLTAACSLNDMQAAAWTKFINIIYEIFFTAIDEQAAAIV